MSFMDKLMDIWDEFYQKAQPVLSRTGEILGKIGRVLVRIFDTLFKMRKVIAAIPVAAVAIYLALYNQTHLPSVVELNLVEILMEDGMLVFQTVTHQIARGIAVFIPLTITLLCLLLLLGSRRILTPWLVSLLTLVLPVVILLTNVFPV